MKKNVAAALPAVLLAIMVSLSIASAQDFQKGYAISSGGRISVSNVSGDIKVTGYNIGSIEVIATKTGRDRDLVQVEDTSSGDRIELSVKYPEHCHCDASVNFDIRVPAGVDYDYQHLASVSGNVEVTGVRGRLNAKSVSGNVTLSDVTGIAKASSVSGNVEAQIVRLEGTGEMKFSSVSGNVLVKAPANLNADIEMSSLSGTLDTDFPIEIQSAEYGPGRSARGRIGNASNTLKLSTVSGKVGLAKI